MPGALLVLFDVVHNVANGLEGQDDFVLHLDAELAFQLQNHHMQLELQ